MRPYFFSDHPIKRRLFLLIASVTGGALLLSSVFALLSYTYILRETMTERLEIVAKSIAEQTVAEFNLRQGAKPNMDILAYFKNDPDIELAVIYDTGNVAYVTYRNSDQKIDAVPRDAVAEEGEGYFFQNGRLKFRLVHPIQFEGKHLGEIFILSGTGSLISHLVKVLLFMAVGCIVSLGCALLAAVWLQRCITKPVSLSAKPAGMITRQEDASLATAVSAKHEIGDLIADFNLTPEAIQQHDEQLLGHQLHLEQPEYQRAEENKKNEPASPAEKGQNEPSNESISPIPTAKDKNIADITTRNDRTRRDTVQMSGKALLVDDEPITRKVVSAILRNFGLEIEIADSGLAALQMFETNAYVLVLMDIHMPEMNGLEASRRIRILEKEMARQPAIIIAMSANSTGTIRRQCLAGGMDEFLSKPIQSEKLVSRLRSRLDADKNKRKSAPAVKKQCKPTAKPQPELWSRARALEFVGGDEPLFSEIATVFLGRNDLLLQRIETAIKSADVDALLESAHAYKGAVGHFACPILRQTALSLENMARNGRTEGGEDYLVRLREKSRVLCRELYQVVVTTESGEENRTMTQLDSDHFSWRDKEGYPPP